MKRIVFLFLILLTMNEANAQKQKLQKATFGAWVVSGVQRQYFSV